MWTLKGKRGGECKGGLCVKESKGAKNGGGGGGSMSEFYVGKVGLLHETLLLSVVSG